MDRAHEGTPPGLKRKFKVREFSAHCSGDEKPKVADMVIQDLRTMRNGNRSVLSSFLNCSVISIGGITRAYVKLEPFFVIKIIEQLFQCLCLQQELGLLEPRKSPGYNLLCVL